MNRIAASLFSVFVAYGVCAASGVNRWMYIWLKGFYASYAVCMWVIFALLFTLYGVHSKIRSQMWVVVGLTTGYLAGIVAYQLGPAIKDGSFLRSTSTVAVQGLPTYLETSALGPLLCLSPLAGMIAAVVFMAFTEKTSRYVAGAVLGAVFAVGWGFFLSHGALPGRW
jgi:hypothetical protein